MREYVFEVIFESGWKNRVTCLNEDEAKILAQANAIRNGLEYRNVKSITKVTK